MTLSLQTQKTNHSFLLPMWLFLLFTLLFNWSSAQSCGESCSQTHCIEQICQQCLEYNNSCPPWLQGHWSGLHLRQDGTAQQAQPWQMEVVGYNVTMTGQGVSGLRGRTYCNIQERGSSSGGASAYDMDLIYDSPKGYKGSASPSIIQLYHDGLSVNNMELQVMLPFRFVPYEPDDCATPRIPPSEFSPPIPLTYWVVRYECTTPRLTHACPHWYDGKWAASAWSPRGGIAGSFIQPSQFLSVSGVSLTMTAGEKGEGEEEGTDVVSTQYAFKCTQHFISDINSNLEINLGVDLATTLFFFSSLSVVSHNGERGRDITSMGDKNGRLRDLRAHTNGYHSKSCRHCWCNRFLWLHCIT